MKLYESRAFLFSHFRFTGGCEGRRGEVRPCAEQEQLLKAALEKRFNAQVEVKVEVNPALIAGVVIRAGDQVIDDSALNKLEKMRTRLLA